MDSQLNVTWWIWQYGSLTSWAFLVFSAKFRSLIDCMSYHREPRKWMRMCWKKNIQQNQLNMPHFLSFVVSVGQNGESRQLGRLRSDACDRWYYRETRVEASRRPCSNRSDAERIFIQKIKSDGFQISPLENQILMSASFLNVIQSRICPNLPERADNPRQNCWNTLGIMRPESPPTPFAMLRKTYKYVAPH